MGNFVITIKLKLYHTRQENALLNYAVYMKHDILSSALMIKYPGSLRSWTCVSLPFICFDDCLQIEVSQDVLRLLGSLSFEKSTLEHSLDAFQRGLKQGVQGYIRLLANWLINIISCHSGSNMNLMRKSKKIYNAPILFLIIG